MQCLAGSAPGPLLGLFCDLSTDSPWPAALGGMGGGGRVQGTPFLGDRAASLTCWHQGRGDKNVMSERG